MFARYTERVFSVVGTIEMCFDQPSMICQRQMAPSLIFKAQNCKPDFSHTPSTHIYMMSSKSMLDNLDLLRGLGCCALFLEPRPERSTLLGL